MPEFPILASKLIQSVRACAADYPDRLVSECVYFDLPEDDEHLDEACWVCLLGAALARLGYSPSELLEHGLRNDWEISAFGSEFLIANLPEIGWLDVVQSYQDVGRTWEDSVNLADEEVPSLD